MKHLTAFLLLAVFLYHLVGVYPMAMWQQHQLRREAEQVRRAALPDEALVRITVARRPGKAAPRLHWQEEHEFSLQGQLYDVVRQRATADSITYFCWHDHQEEKLLAGLSRHVQEYAHPAAGARKSAKKAFSYLFKINYLPPASDSLPVVTGVESPLAYPEYAALLSAVDVPILFPPPRQVAVSRG